MSFKADLEQAETRQEPLPDLLSYWTAQVKEALPRKGARTSADSLAKIVAKVAWADLCLMKTRGWNPDAIMASMFQQGPKTPDEWSRSLAKEIEANTPGEFVGWFTDAQERLLIECRQATVALKESDEDVEFGVQALIAESFAACVIATAGTGKTWRAVLEARHE